ncbi:MULTISPECIES: helix-turn-helix transcriptional regulator [unclassified Kitasatospora]|uniref:helix-turn-helix transcriptional regulator n=1 Tax=unclassified Kitasatospora TaxID=2633591 RepID=UPI0007090AA5|nr:MULTISPECIES: helix-turn-helix transcriptional regulator [unclassified Kitasatospora]KQV18551.1 XRE family transcriptional regulator [Kitasatospora sp. Root107]KRB74533.1 XRE family transcriptional regulator [Kitasatospora sp. Root187]
MTTLTEPSPFPAELRRRRTERRLSQLDLALRAGTTQRHLSFMERGRSRPGRTMVIRIAESLDLPLRDRNSLLHSAGYAPVYPESRLETPMLGPVREALEVILRGHLPYPALVLRPYGELVAANSAVDLITEGCSAELLAPPVNMLRLLLHPDGMARRVLNLPQWGRHVTENMHRALANGGHDPRLAAFIAELEGYLPPAAPDPDHLGFAVPLRLATPDGELRLITTITSFATALDVTLAELHLEAFLPADEATATILRARATPGTS